MEFILFLLGNPVFQIVVAFCSIAGVILAIVPKTRKMLFPKRKIRIKKQEVIGTNNIQAGGNIHLGDYTTKDTIKHQETFIIGSQTIKGDNNKQAGGDINA